MFCFIFCIKKDCAADRILKLKPAENGSALRDHVIKSLMVKSDSSCLAHCYVEENCMSYNLGAKRVDDTHKCELSNSDHLMHPEDLVRRDGFIYQPFEVRIKLHIFSLRCNSPTPNPHPLRFDSQKFYTYGVALQKSVLYF